MILREDYADATELAELALAALSDAGVPFEQAAQMAISAGAASADNRWGVAELYFHLARMLRATGQDEFALPMLRRALPSGGIDLDAATQIPPDLFPLLRSGVLSQTGEASWRLDAAELASPGEALELTYAGLVRVFSARLIRLWQMTDGRGQLELAGWRQHARKFSTRHRETARRCRSWRRDFEDALSRQAEDLGLSNAPRVVIAEPI